LTSLTHHRAEKRFIRSIENAVFDRQIHISLLVLDMYEF